MRLPLRELQLALYRLIHHRPIRIVRWRLTGEEVNALWDDHLSYHPTGIWPIGTVAGIPYDIIDP